MRYIRYNAEFTSRGKPAKTQIVKKVEDADFDEEMIQIPRIARQVMRANNNGVLPPNLTQNIVEITLTQYNALVIETLPQDSIEINEEFPEEDTENLE